MATGRTQARVVLYGHAAYHSSHGECTIPDGTSITFYTPPGILLDAPVAHALANGEVVTGDDLTYNKADWYFIKSGMAVPPDQPASFMNGYPKTFNPGDRVPNYYLNPDEPVAIASITPLNPVATELVTTSQKTYLCQLLEEHKGRDLHWAACTFAKTPDASAVGYGYECRLAYTSPLKPLYKPELTEAQKREARLKRFDRSHGFFTRPHDQAASLRAQTLDRANSLAQYRQREAPY